MSKQIAEVKASGEESEVMDPTGKTVDKRKADKGGAGDKGEKVSDGVNKEAGDGIETVATVKDKGRAADKKKMSENIESLFDGEELSEEFMERASTIFEAAVIDRVNELKEEIASENETLVAEAIESAKTELEESVNTYLDFIIKEWVENNELAIESGIKADVTESFLAGMKSLFEEHYVSIPEDKLDIAEELADRVAELEETVNQTIAKNLELTEQIKRAEAEDILQEVSEGLTDTQKEKLSTLAEDLSYNNTDQYRKKLETIKESYLNIKTEKTSSTQDSLNEEVEENPNDKVVHMTPQMSAYVKAASATVKK